MFARAEYANRQRASRCKREGNTSTHFTDFCLKKGSSQGRNLALALLFVPNPGPLVYSNRQRVPLSTGLGFRDYGSGFKVKSLGCGV